MMAMPLRCRPRSDPAIHATRDHVATPGVSDAQVASADQIHRAVRGYQLPVAVNCSIVPLASERLFAVTVIDCSVAVVTVSVVDPDTPDRVALMSAVPVANVLTNPPFWPFVILATLVFPDCHWTEVVIFWVLPLL